MTAHDLMFILLTGAGATAVTDLWTLLRRRIFGTPLPNFGFAGRWIAHMARGRFRHGSIAAAEPVRAERVIGWITHYLTGVAFALLLPAFWGREWIWNPTLLPALIVGIGTVAAPFFVMQPAMGLRPSAAARVQSFVMHAVFGIGLYLAARAAGAVLSNGMRVL
jgi:Protein of unknown function (DUF2938)